MAYDVWFKPTWAACRVYFWGVMAANCHIGDLELSRDKSLSLSLSHAHSDHTTSTRDVMASRPSPFGILASTIPTEHCPPLWLIKGSGVIGWLIAPCRLWFFSLMAGWNGSVLTCFENVSLSLLVHAARLQKKKKDCDHGVGQKKVRLMLKLRRRCGKWSHRSGFKIALLAVVWTLAL